MKTNVKINQMLLIDLKQMNSSVWITIGDRKPEIFFNSHWLIFARQSKSSILDNLKKTDDDNEIL